MDLEPVSFTKRVSHPPFARGAYNSEEWVFDDEDDDDVAAERDEFGDQDEPRRYSTSIPDDGIRSLEVNTCYMLCLSIFVCIRPCDKVAATQKYKLSC